jgi:hypothetical protein
VNVQLSLEAVLIVVKRVTKFDEFFFCLRNLTANVEKSLENLIRKAGIQFFYKINFIPQGNENNYAAILDNLNNRKSTKLE